MLNSKRLVLVAALAAATMALPTAAMATHATRVQTPSMHALGHSPHVSTFLEPDGVRSVNSDLAFWGQLAFNGNYNGFRVIDVSAPGAPREIVHQECNGDHSSVKSRVRWPRVVVDVRLVQVRGQWRSAHRDDGDAEQQPTDQVLPGHGVTCPQERASAPGGTAPRTARTAGAPAGGTVAPTSWPHQRAS